jgi:S1-C subfamily serine protease
LSRPEARDLQPRWIPPRGDGKLGVWAYNTDTGVVITRVAPGSAAARSGLEQGDRIVSVGGYQVGYVGDLLYPLGFELRRHADRRGAVLLLVQNVRNSELVNLPVQLDRPGRDRPVPLERE